MEIDNIVKAKSNKHKQQQDIKQNHFFVLTLVSLVLSEDIERREGTFFGPPMCTCFGNIKQTCKMRNAKEKVGNRLLAT